MAPTRADSARRYHLPLRDRRARELLLPELITCQQVHYETTRVQWEVRPHEARRRARGIVCAPTSLVRAQLTISYSIQREQ